ncbi:MAG: hypothetical protein AB9834_17210 [Lentimicrobium sp.]
MPDSKNKHIFADIRIQITYRLISTSDMKQKLPFILLIFIGMMITFTFYGKVITNPDSFMFANSGDGLKNYFTYCYHIQHDSSCVDFKGMNYPYGEHFMYTDCHPVLATVLRSLSGIFPFFSNSSAGILNFLMIFSVFLTFVVVYFLLVELIVNRWFSLLFAIGITLLAPQVFRMGGHLALSYSIAIPLAWRLIIRSLKHRKRYLTIALIFLNNTFWFFIHAYLGIMLTFFLVLILIIHFLSDKERVKYIRHSLALLAVMVIPAILFFLFIRITDSHTGRTDNPSGFFLYVAEADDVFVPSHPPLRPVLDSLTGNGIRQQWEAWSYVGLFTTLLVVVFIFMGLFRLAKRKNTAIDRFFTSRILNISLLAAFLVLLFAMAVPFRQFPVLADIIPYVKQFRALGRFTWPFYFVITVFTATVLSVLYERSGSIKGRNIVIGLALLAGLANIAEALPYHREMSWSITRSPNLFQRENLSKSFKSALDTIQTEDYQAIVTLPFFYQGSESYSRPRSEESSRASMVFAFHTGIPLVCANLTRTSIQESKNIVQLVSPDYYKKGIESDLPDNRPFLVIRTSDALTEYEEAVFRKCRPLFQSNEISLYSLLKADLFSSSAPAIFANFRASESQMFQRDGFFLTKDSSFLYYNDFENLKSEKPFRGKGGFQSVKKGKNVLTEFGPGTFKAGNQYQISVWMFNGMPDALNMWFRFIVEEYDETADTWKSTTWFPEHSEVINGDWSLVEGVFEVSNPNNRIYIVTIGKKEAREPLFVDDLLIREKGTDVYRFNDGYLSLFYNNHEVPAEIPAAD